MKHLLKLSFLFTLLSYNSNAQMWRLSQEVHQVYDFNNSIYNTDDSIIYTYDYNAGRGSNEDASVVKYDKKREFSVSNGAATPLNDYLQKFYWNNNTNYIVKYDWSQQQNRWVVNSVDSYAYDGGQVGLYLKLEYLHQGGNVYALYPTRRIRYGYNNHKDIIFSERSKSYAFSNVWTNDLMYKYTYDGQNRLITDTLYGTGINDAWKLSSFNVYDYDANNNMKTRVYIRVIPSGYDTSLAETYTWNSSGQLVADTQKSFQNNTWVANTFRSYTHLPNGYLHTDSFFSIQSANPPQLSRAYQYNYNQYNYITDKIYYLAPQTKEKTLYTYEIYWPLDVNNNTASSGLQVYPVPASGILNIKMSLKQPQTISAQITDISGKKILSWQEPAGINYHKQVPVRSLEPGVYFLQVQTSEGKTTRQFIVQ